MKPAIELDGARVFHGDCRDVLAALPDNSVDSIVTDPPYELGFMGKSWDASGIAYNSDVWEQCLRVLKPGGHLLAFGGTRTWHRLAVAVEDAGFEVRDSIAWIYGSGFPKSLDVSKAIDKKSGYEGDVIGSETVDVGIQSGSMHAGRSQKLEQREIRELSPEAKKWQGWGTALKPAFEPIVVARKPLIGTVAETVLEWGTGGLNIDGSRIQGAPNPASWTAQRTAINDAGGRLGQKRANIEAMNAGLIAAPEGRWPANVILDEVTAGLLDEQSGVSRDGVAVKEKSAGRNIFSEIAKPTAPNQGYGGQGGASRFFYCAKASKRDRNEGLDGLPEQVGQRTHDGGEDTRGRPLPANRNTHPTVKPAALMRYLVKLVTPPGGTVLDPFTGSGSTGKAAILEGFDFVGVELTDDYLPIIEGRLKWALDNQDEGTLF